MSASPRLSMVLVLALLGGVGSLSAQQGQYGTIPSTFSVDGFSGEATYSMAIFTPEGPGGVRPGLSLEYRHRSGDGPLGLGWGIGGLSEITRCPQTIAQDGKARGVRFDAQDQFCLDGQRLIRTAGTHGAGGSQYRTEIDGFRKVEVVTSGSGPLEFLVTDRDGTRYSYGHAQNSSLLAGSAYRNWRLYRVQDRFNNSVNYHWEKNDTTGEHRLTSVTYGGANVYQVTFAYVTKPTAHQRSGFIWSQPWADPKRLTTIAVQNYNGGWQQIHNYNLTYVPEADSPHHSLLEGVQQCGPTQCFNGSMFEWADGQINLSGFGSVTGVDPFQWTPESHTGRSQSWGKPRRDTRRSFAGKWSSCIGLVDRCASSRRSSAARPGRSELGSSKPHETRVEATAA